MRLAVLITALLQFSLCFAASPPQVPLASGTYRFQWKDAEFPNSSGFAVKVKIKGQRIRIVNEKTHGSAPIGVLEEGLLMWHAKSSQWIVGNDDSDKEAESAGGCDTSAPSVVDFKTRVIWTCMYGP
jgi:hypothetical protein